VIRLAAVVLGLSVTADAAAQDALRGKRLYLDTARIVGATVSCVDCHRAYPPGLFGIGRAANSPAIVANALNTIPQMMPLRGRLTTQDIADVAAYLGNPSVPSPLLLVTTRSPSGAPGTDRVDFGTVPAGQTSQTATVQLRNDGALAMQLTSNPRIVGSHGAEFAVASSSCTAAVFGAAESCEINLTFRPAAGVTGLRSAAVQIDHDWVGGVAAMALIGTADASAANPPVAAGGGGGTLDLCALAGIAGFAALRRRTQDR
jgi:cytochrome c553